MILIYAYIKKFRNYINQEIVFDHRYTVSYIDNTLSVQYNGDDDIHTFCHGKNANVNLHLLIGKTGSGKTNLLQLIGSKNEARTNRKWNGEDDAYFLLYRVNESEFFMEICDMDIRQFPAGASVGFRETLPEEFQMKSERMDSLRTVHFAVASPLRAGIATSDFAETDRQHKALVKQETAIFNCYDIHSLIKPPYDEKEDYQDFYRSNWIGRMNFPYQRTALWQACDYIREYMKKVETGALKQDVSFVLSTHNFADSYPLKLKKNVEDDYWTFYQRKRDEELASFDEKAQERVKRWKKDKELSAKAMFIHDLWTDYAHYLRKWVEKILNFNSEDTTPEDHLDASGTKDVYREFIDYYIEKEYKEDIDPMVLPDGISMSIVKRCTWLAEYIDRVSDGDPHGLLWQITDDIKDIGKILNKLDDKYFTVDTFTIPVKDMVKPEYKELFEDLFERMEQYRPDDAGIFTKCLLPYEFTHLSTGEYQFAKVLGGIREYMDLHDTKGKSLNRIILLDEPEAYMHPELTREFISRLYDAVGDLKDDETIQIIIGTHSPFLVSDVFPDQITRLDIDSETGYAIVRNSSEKVSFGANLHTIFADGFFLEYTIGEFSRRFLQEQYGKLQLLLKKEGTLTEEDRKFVNSLKDFIPQIGDSLIRRTFEIMMELFDNGTEKLKKYD